MTDGETVSSVVVDMTKHNDDSMKSPEPPEQVPIIRVGWRVAVRLQSNPSTGYCWIYKEERNAGALSADKPEYETTVTHGENRTVSGPLVEVHRFTALRSGACTLLFEYRRPWEKDKPANKTYRVYVRVVDE